MQHPARLLLPLLAAAFIPALHAAPAVDPRIDALLTELGKARAISAVQMSPDGSQLAWVVRTDGKDVIEVAKADGSGAHRVGAASGDCNETDPAWAPDSHRLAYVANCGSGQQKDLLIVDTQTKESPHHMASLPGVAQGFSWSPDGKSLGFLYVPNGTRRASAVYAAKPASGEIGVDGLEVQRVAAVDAGGGAVRLLSPEKLYAYEFAWSPDSQRIAYTAAPPPGDNNWWLAKLYVQNAQAQAKPDAIVDPSTVKGPLHGLQMALPRWSADGQRIGFIGGLMSDQGATGGDIYAVPACGGEPVNLTAGTTVTPAWFDWFRSDEMIVAHIRNGQSEVAEYGVTPTKATQEVLLFTLPASIGDGSAEMALSLSADRTKVAFVQSSYTEAPEVHAGPLSQVPPPAVTRINAALKPGWGKAESVEWDNEGHHVQGWLLYPANYDPKKSYPMIVTVHGGPSSAVIPRWPRMGFGGEPFSALGYFVFMPNPRGSFGQGEAYVQANRKDFGHGDLRDILAGIDAIEKKLPVDDKRLGLTGWSYGGFMSMFIPTQTQRFRAVVAGAGIANWQSYYGQNLIDQWMIPFFGASVYDDPQVYAKSSPIDFIKQTKSPTLVVVGDRDAECPAPQSFEYWHALRALGVPTSLVVYPNEGHHFVDPDHQRDVLQRALMWFEKYLPPSN
ncbi:Dipeptidyl aminopeptidase/acylaminoacyl peptidase [Dyella jiangningensis]|uniref:S9 family peptidase n=2 Tax=Gammaproteobacteria TaxID=1236 RepID=UPI0008817E43|nr:S9 family peptidase [Dyella sp. AtDHG13]PXV56934.1 dipeptidyl aminopeptidase/acylaminoacyl peptidase [Dyella sp. AtDHG13]SDK61526.1 Dipeptidyl aminopeptidase/acylaminoacyl peptidase [Dyella jiangningensis]